MVLRHFRLPALGLTFLLVCVGLLAAACDGDTPTLYCGEQQSICLCAAQPLHESWEPRPHCNEYRCPYRVPDTGECFSFIILVSTDPNASIRPACSDPHVTNQAALFASLLSRPTPESANSCP